MKTISKILLIGAIIASIGVGCKPNNPPTGQACSGQATIDGIVTNEDGDSLNGIRIDVYYDEQLLEHFPSQEKYDWWDTVSIEHKQKYPFDNPIHYTNYDGKAGYYRVSTVAIVGIDVLDLYVVATDTAGVYETQMQQGSIKYKQMDVFGYKAAVGSGTVDFVLKKKE